MADLKGLKNQGCNSTEMPTLRTEPCYNQKCNEILI